MKSFFKKLSFVMALAMVISLVAPAGSALADEAGIALQGTKKVIADYSVEVGGEDEVAVDFCFVGAPADWKTTYKWTSSKEDVATVDKAGKVTALKDGVTEITITAGADGAYKHTVVLTVGKGDKADNSFEVRQTTANTVELTFADEAAVTKNIEVTKLGKTTAGVETEMVWPVNTVTVKGNVATVTVWVDFGTGDYRFTANEVSVDKFTEVGEPALATVIYKDTYAYSENGGNAITPEITVYDANGVKLTGYNNWYFELLNTDADAYVENATGNLYLWNVGSVAQIKATLTYVVGTESKTLPAAASVVGVKKPEYEVSNSIEKYALVKNGTTADKITWGKSDVIIDDGSYWVAGIIKDSEGKTKSISDISADSNNAKLDANKYYVRYATSNPTVALVEDTKGEVIGINVGKAYALVSLYKADASGDSSKDVNIGVIAAVPVNVCAARKATTVTLDKSIATLLTSGDYSTVDVTATTKDQYNEERTDTIKSVYAKVNDVTFSNENGYVTIATLKDDSGNDVLDANGKVINTNKFTIDAAKFAGKQLNSLSFTVEMNSGLKTTFVLAIKELPAKVNVVYALNVKGAEVAKDESATVRVVSAWAGSKLNDTAFYFGKPENPEIGDLYVTVTGPDGKDLTPTTTATTSTLSFKAITSDTASATALKTMATGKYIVKLNQVTQKAKDSKGNVIVNSTLCDTQVFEITNNLKPVTDFKVLSTKYTDSNDIINTTTVEFKVDGTLWKDNNKITVASVNKKELDGSVYVYDFTVRIPFGDKGAYYEVNVPVGKIFTK